MITGFPKVLARGIRSLIFAAARNAWRCAFFVFNSDRRQALFHQVCERALYRCREDKPDVATPLLRLPKHKSPCIPGQNVWGSCPPHPPITIGGKAASVGPPVVRKSPVQGQIGQAIRGHAPGEAAETQELSSPFGLPV